MKALRFLSAILVLLTAFSVQAKTLHSSKDGDDEKTAVSASSSLPTNPKTKEKFRYYYYPNMMAYYDNLNQVFYFKVAGEWKTAAQLPCLYGGYSLFKNRKVIIDDFFGDKPFEMLTLHKAKYPYDSRGRLYKEENI